MKIGIWT